jgi:hypothetical protein
MGPLVPCDPTTGRDLQPAPGQPGSDQLPFMAAFGNSLLIDCHCSGWPWNRGGHTRGCLASRADAERARELADALLPEDIRWLNDQGWDGQFG